jgi:hypothetical protein
MIVICKVGALLFLRMRPADKAFDRIDETNGRQIE